MEKATPEKNPRTPSYRMNHLRDDYIEKFKELTNFIEDDLDDLLSEKLDLSKSYSESIQILKKGYSRPIEKKHSGYPADAFGSDEDDYYSDDHLFLEEDLQERSVALVKKSL